MPEITVLNGLVVHTSVLWTAMILWMHECLNNCTKKRLNTVRTLFCAIWKRWTKMVSPSGLCHNLPNYRRKYISTMISVFLVKWVVLHATKFLRDNCSKYTDSKKEFTSKTLS